MKTMKTSQSSTARVRRNGEYCACFKSNCRPFWFGNYSTCKRKAGKTGFVREVKSHE